jgi:hypothetical protein
MALAIHSACFLFCSLQVPLKKQHLRRFHITHLMRQALHDWTDLLYMLQTLPVPIAMLVPTAPHYWAATDASKEGMEGFGYPQP